MKVEWENFKEFVNSRNLSIQWVDLGNQYWLKGIDGNFSLECFLSKENAQEFEDSYKSSGNKTPKSEVITQKEKNDKQICLFSTVTDVNENGLAVINIKIPGSLAAGGLRYISGGSSWFNNPTDGDRIEKIEVVDSDNVLGYGAGLVLNSWHDIEASESEQGWFFPIHKPVLSIQSLGGYGKLLSELHLRFTAKKGGGITTGKLYINLFWGSDFDSIEE